MKYVENRMHSTGECHKNQPRVRWDLRPLGDLLPSMNTGQSGGVGLHEDTADRESPDSQHPPPLSTVLALPSCLDHRHSVSPGHLPECFSLPWAVSFCGQCLVFMVPVSAKVPAQSLTR